MTAPIAQRASRRAWRALRRRGRWLLAREPTWRVRRVWVSLRSRVSRRFWWRLRWVYWRVAISVVLLTLASLALIWLWKPERVTCKHASCYVPVDLLSSAIVAAFLFIVYFFYARVWVLWRRQRNIRLHPERLLDDSKDVPTLEHLVPRQRLYRAVFSELRAKEPKIPLICGDLGAGKTVFLLALASHLAEQGLVPVFVSLRHENPPFDLPALAQRSFLRGVGSHLFSAAAADRLWREVWRQRRIVVLADGLDEALVEGQVITAHELASGFDDSQGRAIARLVLASRPEPLGTGGGYTMFPLEPLDPDHVRDVLAEQYDRSDESPGAIEEITELLDVRRTPFFLEILVRVLREDHLPAVSRLLCEAGERPRTRDQAQVALLDRYLKVNIADARNEAGVTGRQAEDCVAELARLAALTHDQPSFERERLLESAGGFRSPGRSAELIATARRLDLLAAGSAHSLTLRFRHPILHAYLLSLRLGGLDDKDRGRLLRDLLGPYGPGARYEEALLALRMFAAGERPANTPGARRRVCETLFAQARAQTSIDRAYSSALVACAVRIEASDGSEQAAARARAQVAASMVGERPRRTPDSPLAGLCTLEAWWDTREQRARRTLRHPKRARQPVRRANPDVAAIESVDVEAAGIETVRALAELARSCESDSERQAAYKLLWRLGDSPSYWIRWQVVESFASCPRVGFDAISDSAAELIATARGRIESDPMETVDAEIEASVLQRLSVLAKFLPMTILGQHLEEPNGPPTPADRLLGDLVSLVKNMTARARPLGIGVEASLAQGLKYAADRPGAEILDQFLFPRTSSGQPEPSFCAQTVFWYSKVNALQAAARRAISLAAAGGKARDLTAISEHLYEEAKVAGHPFVKETARLCRRAVSLARRSLLEDARSCIWHDEAEEVRSSGTRLSAAASQLLADIVLVLNMNEQGRSDGRRPGDPVDSFGTATTLPACMSAYDSRERLLSREDACPGAPACAFKLCGYRPELAHTHAYRGLSAAFCRHQRDVALRRPPLTWQPRLAPSELQRFWAEMLDGRVDEGRA
jgi:hypothetical protein